MKAYIIHIQLLDSNPSIWRRVVLPSGATYNRLHDIIQNITNFKSGYPYDACHLYEFNLEAIQTVVTNDHTRYEEHKLYKKNKKSYEQRLKNMEARFMAFEKASQERLKIVVRQPQTLKIDDYLETYKTLVYHYDFGDDWRFQIDLELIVENYHFGFPTILDGAEDAPPEDIGGLNGYYEFLEILKDTTNSNYLKAYQLAQSNDYRSFDLEWLNDWLKSLKYKKTEWDKIDHVNYKIIKDPYRK